MLFVAYAFDWFYVFFSKDCFVFVLKILVWIVFARLFVRIFVWFFWIINRESKMWKKCWFSIAQHTNVVSEVFYDFKYIQSRLSHLNEKKFWKKWIDMFNCEQKISNKSVRLNFHDFIFFRFSVTLDSLIYSLFYVLISWFVA